MDSEREAAIQMGIPVYRGMTQHGQRRDANADWEAYVSLIREQWGMSAIAVFEAVRAAECRERVAGWNARDAAHSARLSERAGERVRRHENAAESHGERRKGTPWT